MDEKLKEYRHWLASYGADMISESPLGNEYDNGIDEGLDIALAEFDRIFMEEK